MTMDEIQAKLQELLDLISNPDSTEEDVAGAEEEVSKLEEEKKSLLAQQEERKATEEKRSQTIAKIKRGLGSTVEQVEEREVNKTMTNEEILRSADYKNGFLRSLLGKELSETEQRAVTSYTHTTANTAQPLPTTMVDQIWDLVSDEHAIFGDITSYKTGTIMEVVAHTAIVKGKAKSVAENATNDDEQNTFVKVTLSGKDFAKDVELSYAMANMSISAFEDYLINEIATSLGEALAEEVVTQVKADMNTANKITATTSAISYKDITGTFATLKKAKEVVVYVNRATLYNQLCAMVDSTGRPIYQPNAQAGAEGSLLGATVKVESALADGEILVGDSKQIIGNVVTDVMVETDKDIKAHKYIYSGYTRFECKLINDLAFALLTPKATV